MLAMGRGLNIAFWLAFQEISGLWARLGEKTASLLGNANLTIAMRQQDAERTRNWIEKTAGETEVTQATSFVAGDAGNYREGPSAEVRKINRVAWSDLQKLLEGEAVILLGGRRVYAKLYHAEIEVEGPVRRNRPVMLAGPTEETQEEAKRIIDVLTHIETGRVPMGVPEQPDAVLTAMVEAFGASGTASLSQRAAAAVAAAGLVVMPRPASDPGTEPPVTSSTAMLESGTAPAAPPAPAGAGSSLWLRRSPQVERAVAVIEVLAGNSPEEAQAAAAAVGQALAEARLVTLPEPPTMRPEELAGRLRDLTARLAS